MSEFSSPIDLYYWPTPNCWKITIFCEEVGIPYVLHPVNILELEQLAPAFVSRNRWSKVPIIEDANGPDESPIVIAESAANLLYLSQKSGHLRPASRTHVLQVLQWLLFQIGTVGPMLGQAHHFRSYTPQPIPYAIDRYTSEATKIYRVLDRGLAEAEYLAGEFSLADIAVFPWTLFYKRQGQSKGDLPNFARCFDALKARPAFQKGVDAGKELRTSRPLNEQLQKIFQSSLEA